MHPSPTSPPASDKAKYISGSVVLIDGGWGYLAHLHDSVHVIAAGDPPPPQNKYSTEKEKSKWVNLKATNA